MAIPFLSDISGKNATFAGNVNAGTGLRMYTDGSGNGVIYNLGQDKDLYLVGDDGGSGINALVFDMSEGGAATFAGKIKGFQAGTGTSNSASGVAELSGQAAGAELNALSVVNSVTAASGNATSVNFHNASNYSPTGKIQVIQEGSIVTDSSMKFYTYGTVSGVTSFTPKLTLAYNGTATFAGTIETPSVIIDSRLVLDNGRIYDNATNGNNKGFRIGGSGLIPINGSAVDTTNIVDLGSSSTRFKDLYLAGGASVTGAVTAGNIISTSNGGDASIYINSTRPTLGFTDTNSFTDANDIYIIRGTGGNKLQFQWYDDSAGSTTETFNIDNSGNATFVGSVGVGVAGGSNAKLEVVSATGEVFRADAASGAFRIVANQTGVSTQGTFSHAGAGSFSLAVTAGSFVKSGGTSSQYLMADGSVSTSVTDTTKLPLAGGTMTGDLLFNVADQEIRFTHDSDALITHNQPGRDIVFKTSSGVNFDKTPLILHGTGGHATLGGDLSLDYGHIGAGTTSYMLPIGFNRHTSDGTIINSSYSAYQLHNYQGSLKLQVYNSAGTYQGQHSFDSDLSTTFAGNITVGDGHFIGDDSFDNLLLQSSTGENLNLSAANDIIFFTGGTAPNALGTQRLRIFNSDGSATFAGNLTVEGDEFTLGTGNYEKVLFNTSPSSVLGNGTMEIQPQTIPGSGTAQFTSYFKKYAGTGTTQHNIKVDGKATIGGNVKLESGTGGTTDKIIFKTTDNADESKFIRTNSYWNEYGAHRNEGHKFIDSNSNILLQLNGELSTTGNGALSATFAGDVTVGGNNVNINSGGGTPSLKITRNLGSGISPGASLGFINIENSASTGSDNRAVIFEGFTDGGSANATGGGLRLYTKNASTGANTVAITAGNTNNVTLHGSTYTNTIYSNTNSAYYIDVAAGGTGLNMAGSATIAGSINVGSGPSRFTHQQNAGSRLELYNNRQDLSNVEVYRIAAYNSAEVTGVHFYRGSGGSSGYTKIFAKKNNASSLEEVVQFGTNNSLSTTFAGDISMSGSNPTISFTADSGIINAATSSGVVVIKQNGNEKFRVDSAGADVTGDLSITGNLTVTGTSTAVNVEDLNVEQGEITLNYAASSDTSSSANGAGIRIQDAVNATTDATILWNTTSDRFEFSNSIQVTGGVTTTSNNNFIGGMSSFETTLTNNDDWQNSPISLRERDNVGSNQSADKYSPNLNFHWGNRVSRSLWMDHSGHLHYGEYSSSGIPNDTAGHFLANEVHASTFKDKDNTAYYVNPAGGSNLAGGITVDGDSIFDDNLRVNGWIRGASNTNMLYSSTSYGTLIQVPGNTAGNVNSKIIFRDSTGNNRHIFDCENGDATIPGNVTHNGLTMTDGTDVDQIKEFSMTFQLAANTWTDTGIDGTDLATGTYVMQVLVDDYAVNGAHYTEYYSGTISWFSTNTNSSSVDEIIVHRAGHAPQSGDVQFRTQRTLNADSHDLMLQVKHNLAYNAALDGTTAGKKMIFKFRRLI